MSADVTNEDTYECAQRLIGMGYGPVVLDFASSTNPGGSWRSKQQGTQEETLCRQSNLGLLLEKQKYPIATDGVIYIPNVIVTKNRLLKDIQPFKCAVIASSLRSIANHSSEYLQMRFKSIYDVALKHKHDALVLGAWGCGAFKETDDDIVILAREFRKFFNKYQVHGIKIVFSVIGKNYKLFKTNFERA